MAVADFFRPRLLYLDVRRPSVYHLNNVDDTRLIIDRVDDPIVTLADTIDVRPACKLFRP